MVHQHSHSSSPNASLKRWVFKSFLKVSVFVSSWRLDGREFHAFGPDKEKLRSPNFSFNRGSSYWKLLEDLSLLSHDQAGQPRMSSCPTGTQDCDQLAPGAWARRACRWCGTWSEASVGSGGLEWCGPAFLFRQQVWPPHSEHVEVDRS